MNIEKLTWGSYDERRNNEGDYNVIKPTDVLHKSPPFRELKRSQSHGIFNRNLMRESLVGFKDGVPGIFSGYAENKVRSSIRKKQPFYGDDDNYRGLSDVCIPPHAKVLDESKSKCSSYLSFCKV